MVTAIGHVFFFFFSDSRIVSHSPCACNWQNRYWDNEPIVARFPNNKCGIQTYESHVTLRSYTPPHVCMLCVVCRVCGLGATYTSKQNIFSLILLILLAKLTNQKRGIYRLRPPFPNDGKTLKPKGGLRPD